MATRQVFRQERKFLLNFDQYRFYEDRFAKVLAMDSNSSKDGYTVRSLYFDALSDRDIWEKLMGVEIRRKIRIRTYAWDAKEALLEMKQKQGNNQLKRSIKISRECAQSLVKGNYTPLLQLKDDFASECYSIMNMHIYKPKVIVEYNRKAFVRSENNTRITFDSNIKASDFCEGLFEKTPSYYPVLNPSNVVMEVKYNNFLLSYIKRILQGCDDSETAVSKYVLARMHKTCF